MLNMDDYILLGSITLFGLWLTIRPSGFQYLVSTMFKFMGQFGLAPRGKGSFCVRTQFIRAFGALFLLIVVWVAFMALNGTLPVQPR